MKKAKRRAVGFLSLLLALAMTLSGCQSGTGESSASKAEDSKASESSKAEESKETESTEKEAEREDKPESDIPNFNPTGYPICDDPVTLKVMCNVGPLAPSDFNDIMIVQRAEEVTNVHIDWLMVPGTGWDEKKNLMLATGDLPDIIESQLAVSDLTRYGPDGSFIPMQDLISEYAVNFTHLYEELPDLERYIVAPDGNTYGMARVNSGPWMTTNGVGTINTAWLDAVGMDMPETLDDFYEVLKAFKEKDPNGNGVADEIPFDFAMGSKSPLTENNGVGYIMASFGIAVGTGDHTYTGVKDGEVICQGTLPEYKEAVTYLTKLYQEGLMSVEGFTSTNADLIAKLNQDPAVIGYVQLWDINDYVSNPENNDAMAYMPILKHADGREPRFYRNPMPGINRGWDTITSACETPEVAIRWIDYFFEETISIEHIEGPIGVRLIEQPDGTLHVREAPEGMTVADDRAAHCNAQTLAVTPSMYEKRLKLPHTDPKVEFVEEYCHPFADPEPMMPVYYTAEESNEMAQLQTDIQTFIDRKTSEWMRNGNIDAEWDNYIKELNSMGLDRWLEIKQEAYDRFMAS